VQRWHVIRIVTCTVGTPRHRATLADFGVAMYCGFGRQRSADGAETMREHARVARTVRGAQ